MEILYIAMENSSRSPVRPYKNCTGQVWYVHWFSSRELSFWSERLVCTVLGSMLTVIWVFSMEILYIAMWILQGHLYGRTRTVQVKSGMSIDSHPERYVLVQTASPYSPGKYVNWNLSFFNGDRYREFFKVTCTAVQELYRSSLVCPLIPIRRAAFWSKRLVRTVLGSMLTGIWVFSMEILYIAMENSSRSPVRPYKNCTGQVWYVHWFPSGELSFWSKRLVCTVLGSMLTGIWVFSMEILYISYGEFFKVTCTAVQELYRSSLVCPLILIWRATFWSKRLVRTVLGSMLTGIWVFSMGILYIAMWILQGHLYGRTRTLQVKSGMSIDSHPESYVLVQTASPYSPGKYVNWNLSFFNGDPVYSYVNSSRSPVRPYKNCTGQVWYVHWFSSGGATFWSKRLVCTVLGSMLTEIWVFVNGKSCI